MKQELAKEILDYIKIHQTVSTLELCDHYHLSESTVRRLLQRIEDSGQITRYHGGAVFNGEQISSEIQKRYLDNVDSKDRIAKKAAEMVKPGSTIIMLGGTTVFRMCKYLRNKAITVITNSTLVFFGLHKHKNIHIVLLGGEYNGDEQELTGFITQNNLQMLTSDYLFFGAAGYVRNIGFTTTDINSVELYHWCMSMVKEKVLLFDSTKFVHQGKAITARNQELDTVITDDNLDPDIKQELVNDHVNVVLC